MSEETVDNKSKEEINIGFVRECLTDEGFAKADLSTIKVYEDLSFIDPDFYKFVYGILLSVVIDGDICYIYMVIKIGNELSETFSESIINCAVDGIKEWHIKNNPHDIKEPIIKTHVFTCDRKSEIDNK